MNVLYVGNLNAKSGFASVSRVLTNAKLFFKTFKASINVVINNYNNELKNSSYLDENNIKIIPHFSKNKFASYINANFYIDFIKKNKIDLVVAYDIPFILGMKLLKFCRRSNIKIIGDITEWFDGSGYRFPMCLIKKMDSLLRMNLLNRKMDGLILISDLLCDKYKKNIHLKIYPLADYILDEADKSGYKKVKDDSSFNWCYFGSSLKGKDDLDKIVKMFSSLRKENSYLYLVGNFKLDPSKFDNFQKNHIILKQYLPHSEVLKLYSKMDCQIILRKRKRSNNAGFPTKVMESIALQTAVLCNDFSDLRFVSKTNPVSFIEEGGLEQLINKNNYQFDISLFSSDYYLDSFAQFVEKIYEN